MDGSGINFLTLGDAAIRQMNIFHEFGHLFDNVSGLKDVFTNAVANEDALSCVSNSIINPEALISLTINNDPNYLYIQARQTYSDQGTSEQWADAFANYVVENIDLSDPLGPGIAMYNFVSGALAQYIGVP